MEKPIIMDPARFKMTVNMGEVNDTSLDLLSTLEESGVSPQVALLAVAMTLGRLTTHDKLDVDEMVSFIQSVLDWTAMYFHTGSVN